jgi:serine/threonine protein kinase
LIPFKALMQRGKGGVYEALDLSVSPVRLVVIKEGRRHGETAWNGIDGYDLVRREAAVLRVLARAGIPVPGVLREFEANGNCYLVLEKIKGRPLFGRKPQPARSSWRRAQQTLTRLEPVIASIHQAGWVWRDCKPSHIFIEDKRVRLIDFEGACKTDDIDVLPWASRNYAPSLDREPFAARQKGTWEDDYALGVIAFHLGAGKFPPASTRSRASVYNRTNCPSALRERIEQLLMAKLQRRLIK